MRDLDKSFKPPPQYGGIDQCQEFVKIKSVILYFNKHIKPINKMKFRDGTKNDQFINELTRRLQEVLVKQNLVDPETLTPLSHAHKRLRKITMYLFANTDTTYMYNLAEDADFAFILEQCPLLSQSLLLTVVFDLKLSRYFCEALAYTPCWFALHYFEPAFDFLKYIDDPYMALEKADELMRAICICIARSEYREIDNVTKMSIYKKLYDYTMNMLRQFYMPEADKFKKTEDYYRYSGFVLKHLSQLVIFSFDMFEIPENATPKIEITVYEICESLCKKVANQNTSEELKKEQVNYIKVLLNSLQYTVKLVNVEIFKYWEDVVVTPNVTLQAVIGDMVYKVEQRILSNPLFANDELQHLTFITIRPKSLQDIIRESTNGDILDALGGKLSPLKKKMWFDELFNRWTALCNDECLETIKENIELMTTENCKLVLNFLKESIELSQQPSKTGQQINEEKMAVDIGEYETTISMLYGVLQNLKEDDILQLIVYQIKLFDEFGSLYLQREDYEKRVTMFLKKFTTTFDYKNFLLLCFENPPRMWTAFFDNACHDLKHVRNFCAISKKAHPLTNIYLYNKLQSTMRDPSKLTQKNFPYFFCEIYFVLYFPNEKTEFLISILNKNVNDFLDMKAYSQLLPIVKSLKLITFHEESHPNEPLNFGELTAPVLILAAHIMDKARWDLVNFTEERDELLCECIHFVQATTKQFFPLATANDREWIASKVTNSCRSFTQYYFQAFSLKLNEQQTGFEHFLMQSECKNDTDAQFFVLKNYVRCTNEETEWLAQNEYLLRHIPGGMILLGDLVTEANNTNAINNYRHCIFKYINIVRKFLLPPIVSDDNAIEKLAVTTLTIIQSAPIQIYDESLLSTSNLLMEIMNACAGPLRTEIVQSVQNLISSMRDCPSKESLMVKMQACLSN